MNTSNAELLLWVGVLVLGAGWASSQHMGACQHNSYTGHRRSHVGKGPVGRSRGPVVARDRSARAATADSGQVFNLSNRLSEDT